MMATTMAKTTTSSANPAEKMAAHLSTPLLEKKSPTNGHSSPARNGKTTPSNADKKPLINGHASPPRAQANSSNKTNLDGYMKTDDRVRLAKERREERERSLAAREQMIKEKERRARLQYERTMEERCRRLEEQRLREEQRRAAVEEKRRQQLEEERGRLEALMKRSMERSLQLEQRSRRWGRGYPGDSENVSLPSAASAFPHGIAFPIPAVSESAPCSPHRSPYRADHSRVVLQSGSQSTPNTPKKQRLRKYRNASPGYGSPLRRSESPATDRAVKQTPPSPSPKVVSKMRTHSPNSLHPSPHSPCRNPSNPPKDVNHTEDKPTKLFKTDSPQRNVQTDRNNVDSKTKGVPPQTVKVNMIEKCHSPERRGQALKPNVCAQEGDKKKDPTPGASTGRSAAEEEATKLLAERRHLARALKEQEEKKRAEEEQAKLREEKLKKPIAQLQDAIVETQNKEIKKVENIVSKTENQKQVNGENLRLNENGKEEKNKTVTSEEVARQQQERDLQKQQEEEERQLRKKRIEEIMKRTRKGEGDLKVEESAEADTGDASVTVDGKVKEQTDKNEAHRKSESKIADTTVEKGQMERQAAPNKESPQSEKNPSASTMKAQKLEEKILQTQDVPKKELAQSKQFNANVKLTDQSKTESMTIVREGPGNMVNGAVKRESLKISSVTIAATNTRQTLLVPKTEAKSMCHDRETKPSVAALPLGRLTPPVIKFAPQEVSGTSSGDEVQSMEVSPVSREELVSIPEFSPVNDALNNALSNNKALEDLMDLTGSAAFPRLSPQNHIGDCNQNLIQGVVSPVSDSKLVGKTPPSPNKLSVK